MVHRSSLYYVGIMALFLAFAVSACSSQQGTPNKNQQKGDGAGGRGGGRPVSVQTATVQRIPVQRSVDLSGNLMSPDQARISSEVAGVVRDVLIEIG